MGMGHLLARTGVPVRAGGQGYAVPAVSFGKRLALFFFLIALVPTLALLAILIFVSHDSRRGKADARLSAGLETASVLYRQRVSDAGIQAKRLASDPRLAGAVKSDDRSQLAALTQEESRSDNVRRVELTDAAGRQIAAAGPQDAVAFARVELTENGIPVGVFRVSTTEANAYAATVETLTKRELVLSRSGAPLVATVTPPTTKVKPDETEDVETPEGEFRGRALTLDPSTSETLLLLGPRTEGGGVGIGRVAIIILVWFLLVAVGLAWALARALTRLHDRVAEQAVTDPLTGLWNRRRLVETLDFEVERSTRFGHELSLLILDIDDFKLINDEIGHLQGDEVLESVADAVHEETRAIDLAARYGGDELALLLIETDREGARNLAERLRERVRQNEVPLREGGSMEVTISVGVATLPDCADSLDSLVDAADHALLRAKRAGKDKIRTAPTLGTPGGASGATLRQRRRAARNAS
jgi:diguanylate cyclase (GGDEF)-like protein